MTKLLILGATGKVGGELVKQALARGFEVTALVRSPQKVLIKDKRLQVVEGSPLDLKKLVPALSGIDAVLSTLGHTDLKESSIVTDSARSLIQAMKVTNVKRFAI